MSRADLKYTGAKQGCSKCPIRSSYRKEDILAICVNGADSGLSCNGSEVGPFGLVAPGPTRVL